MGKVANDGRNKHVQYIKLHRGVTKSAAWLSLSCEARCLLIAIWERHNGTNNGQISFSHREARQALGVGNNKVNRAFRDLEDRGFIICRTKGAFTSKVQAGQGKATEWEITTEPCDGQPAKMSYRKWVEIQIAVPDVGTDGTHVRNRSGKKGSRKRVNGSDSGNRYRPKQGGNGSDSRNTYNIPHRGCLS